MNRPLMPDVVVNGEVIPAADIAAEAQNHNAPAGKPGLAWRAAGRALAVRALVLQHARAKDLTPKPQETEPGKWETEDEALIRQVLDQNVTAEAPTEEAMRAAYKTHPDHFRAPTLFEAAHILIKPGEDETADLARTKSVLKMAQDNPRNFAQIAAEHSDCSSRDNGGHLGQLSSGDTVPEFETAMDAMTPGQISDDLVRTRFGWHIIRLDARSDGDVLPYDAVRDTLSDAMERAAWVRAARQFTDDLVAGAEITGVDMQPA